MAAVTPSYATIGAGAKRVLWENLSQTDDVGYPVQLPKYPDKTIQFFKDFGGGTATFEGSNDPRANPDHADHNDAVWFTLKEVGGALISMTAAGAETLNQAPEWVRPKLSGATNGGMSASLVARK